MTRKEFSNQLVKSREEANCGKNELCRRTGFTFQQLQRLENASNNFSIDNVIKYLDAIEYDLFITKDKKMLLFDNRESFANHFKILRNECDLSQRDFANKVGLSYSVIAGIEYGNKNTAIDNILLCLEGLGCQIIIKKKNE